MTPQEALAKYRQRHRIEPSNDVGQSVHCLHDGIRIFHRRTAGWVPFDTSWVHDPKTIARLESAVPVGFPR